jgi:hypothetical protein
LALVCLLAVRRELVIRYVPHVNEESV